MAARTSTTARLSAVADVSSMSVSATMSLVPPLTKISPTGVRPSGTVTLSACAGSVRNLRAENPITSLLFRGVTQTIVPSGEVMARPGSQPALVDETTDDAGSFSAVARFSTLIRPWAGLARWRTAKLVTYSHRPSGEAV